MGADSIRIITVFRIFSKNVKIGEKNVKISQCASKRSSVIEIQFQEAELKRVMHRNGPRNEDGSTTYLNEVVLPAPLTPKSPKHSPFLTPKLKLLTAMRPRFPNCLNKL